MPSPYYASLPSDIILDAGLLYIGSTLMGPTRGGLKFDPGRKLENVEFDGKRSDVAGLTRVTGYAPKISGKFLPFSSSSLTNIETAGTAAFGSTPVTGTMTPVSASSLWNIGSLLSGVRLVYPRGNAAGVNGYAEVVFPLARCEKWTLAGTDKKEGELDVEFVPELQVTGSVAVEQAPYYILLTAANAP